MVWDKPLWYSTINNFIYFNLFCFKKPHKIQILIAKVLHDKYICPTVQLYRHSLLSCTNCERHRQALQINNQL